MVDLKCGCRVTDDGKFILGENCKTNDCKECNTLTELHPFGENRLEN